MDSKNIKKHKNDVFRLAQLIAEDTRQNLSPEILMDMKQFLHEMENEEINLKSIGVRGDKKKVIGYLSKCYGISDT